MDKDVWYQRFVGAYMELFDFEESEAHEAFLELEIDYATDDPVESARAMAEDEE